MIVYLVFDGVDAKDLPSAALAIGVLHHHEDLLLGRVAAVMRKILDLFLLENNMTCRKECRLLFVVEKSITFFQIAILMLANLHI